MIERFSRSDRQPQLGRLSRRPMLIESGDTAVQGHARAPVATPASCRATCGRHRSMAKTAITERGERRLGWQLLRHDAEGPCSCCRVRWCHACSSLSLAPDDSLPTGETIWTTRRIRVPNTYRARCYRHLLGGETVHVEDGEDGRWIRAADLYRTCPVRMLWAPPTAASDRPDGRGRRGGLVMFFAHFTRMPRGVTSPRAR